MEADELIRQSDEDADEKLRKEIGYGDKLAEAFKDKMENENFLDIQSNLVSLKTKYSEFKSECIRKELDAWEKSQTSEKEEQTEAKELPKFKRLITLADMGGKSNSTKHLPAYSFDLNVL